MANAQRKDELRPAATIDPTGERYDGLPARNLGREPARVLTKAAPARAEGRVAAEDPERIIRRAHYLMARKAFTSDAALADAIGVHRSQISRWRVGEPANMGNAWLLRDLAFAVETLSEHLDSATLSAWLNGHSPELQGESPVESIRGGRLPDVLIAFQAQISGAYL